MNSTAISITNVHTYLAGRLTRIIFLEDIGKVIIGKALSHHFEI